jgi:hypothetical protein
MLKRSPGGSLDDSSARIPYYPLRVRARFEVWRQARRDVHPAVPIEIWQTQEGLPVASTPYIERLREIANGAFSSVLQRLWHEQAGLLLEINTRAAAVVRHDRLGQRETTHHRRLVASLTMWENAAGRATQRMDAAAALGNQKVDHYWGWLLGRHPSLRLDERAQRRSVPRPARIVRDERWSHPTRMFPPRIEPDPNPATVLDQAIRLVVGAPA